MLQNDIFSKKNYKFKVFPHLKDYQEAYRNFSWQIAAKDIAFFPDGKLNAAYNAVDRHLNSSRKDKIALIGEDGDGNKQTFTFSQLAVLSNKFGNLLKGKGAQKGDRIFIFLPRIP